MIQLDEDGHRLRGPLMTQRSEIETRKHEENVGKKRKFALKIKDFSWWYIVVITLFRRKMVDVVLITLNKKSMNLRNKHTL